MKEVFKPLVIENHARTGHTISNYGKIIIPKTGKQKFSQRKEDGYEVVTFQFKQKKKRFRVHRLVAQSFIPNPDNKTMINHIDGDKLNNRADNLEWCTHVENMEHAKKHNLVAFGEDVASAKLKNNDIEAIFSLNFFGIPSTDIAKTFKVSITVIRGILSGKQWVRQTNSYITCELPLT
jgi:hypothetical protein